VFASNAYQFGILQSTIRTMQLARVIGTVVSTVKNSTLASRKLMVIQPLDASLKAAGKTLVAVDSVGAGTGELVFWCRGKEASFPFEGSEVPTDCTIVGIVDSEAHVKNIGLKAAGEKA
jgi:ethanolamine utilization protein EutN